MSISVIRYHNKQQASPSGPPDEAYYIITRMCSINLRMCKRRLLSHRDSWSAGFQLAEIPPSLDVKLPFLHILGVNLGLMSDNRLHLIVQRDFRLRTCCDALISMTGCQGRLSPLWHIWFDEIYQSNYPLPYCYCRFEAPTSSWFNSLALP